MLIALTGAIGTGKSTAAKLLTELGVPVIDADKISHDLTQPRTLLLQTIIEHFGEEYLTPDKKLNRQKLRAHIFDTPIDKLWLETLLHPEIIKIIQEKIQQAQLHHPSYIIIVIPLLFETGKPNFIDEVWVIDTPPEIQLTRLIERDQMTENLAKKIVAQQFPREERLKKADKIILNDGDLYHLKSQILKLHQLHSKNKLGSL